MPRFTVIAEFIDRETGKRLKPGDTFEASGERVDHLKQIGVIGESAADSKNNAAPTPRFFNVTYVDDSGKSVTESIEAASYQEAVNKVIDSQFAEAEVDASPPPQKTATKATAKNNKSNK